METVKKFRLKRSMSQQEFGQAFGLSSKAVSNIETGFRRPSRTLKLVLKLLESLPTSTAQPLIRQLLELGSDRAPQEVDQQAKP